MIAAGLRRVRPKAGGAPSASCCGRNRRDSRSRHSGCVCLNPGRRFLPVAILSSSRRRRSRRSWRVSRMRTSRSSGCGRSRIAGGSRRGPRRAAFRHDGRLEAIDPHRPPVLPLRHRTCVHACTTPSSRATTGRRSCWRSIGPAGCWTPFGRRFASAGLRARGLRAAAACRVLPVVRARSIRPIRPSASGHRHSRRGGSVSVVCRLGSVARRPTRLIWVSAHHVGLDGVPLQDLDRPARRAWGAGDIVAFPPPAPGRAFIDPHACHVPGEREVDQLVTFVDLSPVFALREDLNARHADAIGGPVTFGTLIAWLLRGTRVHRRPHRIHGRCGRVIGIRT